MSIRWCTFLTFKKRQISIVLGIIVIILIFIGINRNNPRSVSTGSSLKNYVIAIDPGHGGRDSGSPHPQTPEKTITLLLSKAIASVIEEQGGKAILTREEDVDLWDYITYEKEIEITQKEYLEDKQLGRTINSRDAGIALGTRRPPTYRLGLRARLLIASQNKADLLISIHTNQYRASSARGAVTLYQPDSIRSQQLAICIQKHLQELLPGRSKPGIIEDNFFILRRSKVPAVLIEVGFISNNHERLFMLSEAGQQAIAQAIANGIRDYFDANLNTGQ